MWEQTDELQFVKKISDNEWEVIEVINVCENFYVVNKLEIDLKDYDLECEVQGYYQSLTEVKETYLDDWKQVVVEIIAENSASLNGVKIESYSNVEKHLKNKYEIIL